jgi:hypothetical protein
VWFYNCMSHGVSSLFLSGARVPFHADVVSFYVDNPATLYFLLIALSCVRHTYLVSRGLFYLFDLSDLIQYIMSSWYHPVPETCEYLPSVLVASFECVILASLFQVRAPTPCWEKRRVNGSSQQLFMHLHCVDDQLMGETIGNVLRGNIFNSWIELLLTSPGFTSFACQSLVPFGCNEYQIILTATKASKEVPHSSVVWGCAMWCLETEDKQSKETDRKHQEGCICSWISVLNRTWCSINTDKLMRPALCQECASFANCHTPKTLFNGMFSINKSQ